MISLLTSYILSEILIEYRLTECLTDAMTDDRRGYPFLPLVKLGHTSC